MQRRGQVWGKERRQLMRATERGYKATIILPSGSIEKIFKERHKAFSYVLWAKRHGFEVVSYEVAPCLMYTEKK